ncbi:hypothetical protein GOODEAATRI_033433 [Goodea atripinnis]|uniref:Uncharacterized protein n=1 Tax=Goodea atripinnis TaxID=208336 RepID=A0ABV0Q344_9TELE
MSRLANQLAYDAVTVAHTAQPYLEHIASKVISIGSEDIANVNKKVETGRSYQMQQACVVLLNLQYLTSHHHADYTLHSPYCRWLGHTRIHRPEEDANQP